MTRELDNNVENRFVEIATLIENGMYDIAVTQSCKLIEVAFKRIYREALSSCPFKDRVELFEVEQKFGMGKIGVEEFTLGRLIGLVEKTKLLDKWAKANGREMSLVSGFNLNHILKLRNGSTHPDEIDEIGSKCDRVSAEMLYNYVKTFYASIGLANVENGIKDSLITKQITIVDGEEFEKVNIALNREKGIIINQSDKTRNISYKVETINNMLTVVYNKTKELAGEEAAEEMLFEMGYDGGKKFGHDINNKWGTDIAKKNMTYEDKLVSWCDFDSEVGWGRFNSYLEVDEEEGKINGILEIKDNFLCYDRENTDVKLCSFIKGYCDGVIEKLLEDTPVELVCTSEQCPLKSGGLNKKKSRKNASCQFRVDIVGDEE